MFYRDEYAVAAQEVLRAGASRVLILDLDACCSGGTHSFIAGDPRIRQIGGLAGVTESVLTDRESLVFEWCRRRALPVAFVLAGGYAGPLLDQTTLVNLHRMTIAAAASA